jgi:hypothetical protein
MVGVWVGAAWADIGFEYEMSVACRGVRGVDGVEILINAPNNFYCTPIIRVCTLLTTEWMHLYIYSADKLAVHFLA